MDAEMGIAETPRASRGLRIVKVAQWTLIPLAVFIALEWGVRRLERRQIIPLGWNWPTSVAPSGKADYILLGSSRVAAAVDTPTFENEMSRRAGRPVGALNLGHGWSYLIQNYLYLRNICNDAPGCLRGVTVIAETPGGRLAFEGQRWDGRWFEPDYAYQLVSLLRAGDLPRFWTARMPFEQKLSITFGFATRWSELIARRAAVGDWLKHEAQRKAAGVMAPVLTKLQTEGASADLSAAAGIRSGEVDVQRARKLAVELSKKAPPPPEPEPKFEDLVIEDLARLIHDAGANLVFFDMPLHSVQCAHHQSADWRSSRDAFALRAAAWNAPILRLDFQAVDDDFPDMWHLRKSRSPQFAASLAARCFEKASATIAARPLKTSRAGTFDHGGTSRASSDKRAY